MGSGKPLQDRVRVLVRPRSATVVPGAEELVAKQKADALKKAKPATKTLLDGFEVKARRIVRTPEGARMFGQPIGSVIVTDPDNPLSSHPAFMTPDGSKHYDIAQTMEEMERDYGTHRWSSDEIGDTGMRAHVFANDGEDPVGVISYDSPDDHHIVWFDGFTDDNAQFRSLLGVLDKQISEANDWNDLEEEDDRELDPDDPDDEGPLKERTDHAEDVGPALDRGVPNGAGYNAAGEYSSPDLVTIDAAEGLPIYAGLLDYRNEALIEVGFTDDDGEPEKDELYDRRLELSPEDAEEFRSKVDNMWDELGERYEADDPDDDEEEAPDSGVVMHYDPDDYGSFTWVDYNQGGEIRDMMPGDAQKLADVIKQAQAMPAPYRSYRPLEGGTDPGVAIDHSFTDLESDYGIVVNHFNDGDIMLTGTDENDLLIDRDKTQGYIDAIEKLLAAKWTTMHQVEEAQ